MPAQWLSNSSDFSERVSNTLSGLMHSAARPARARRLRQVVLVLLVLWAVVALARLLWALFPSAETLPAADVAIINPVSPRGPATSADAIDIERMRSWHLFGEADAAPESDVVQPDVVASDSARDGIEEGARETRLDLKLRGIVASTEDGLGHAIIEYQSRQAVYAVEDKLPVSGQVVLDNRGTYELLVLFEESGLDAQASSRTAPPANARSRPAGAAQQVDKRADNRATALAQSYRARLYDNPQSLADVVSVNAVRQDGALLGYRIGPGKD